MNYKRCNCSKSVTNPIGTDMVSDWWTDTSTGCGSSPYTILDLQMKYSLALEPFDGDNHGIEIYIGAF